MANFLGHPVFYIVKKTPHKLIALFLSSNLSFKEYISTHALVFYISVPSIIVSLNRYLKAPKVSICYETFFGTPCMAFQHFNVFGLHGGWWAEQPPQVVEGAQDLELPLLEGGRGVLLAAVPRAPLNPERLK